jgi:hypothetical protein
VHLPIRVPHLSLDPSRASFDMEESFGRHRLSVWQDCPTDKFEQGKATSEDQTRETTSSRVMGAIGDRLFLC